MNLVITQVKDRIGYAILNRPEKRNALSVALVEQLHQSIQDLIQHPDVKVLVLKSADKPFCAGADLAYMAQIRDFGMAENIADSQRLRALFDLLYHCPKITISQVEGPALAGGCGLATLVDFCFATPEASFGYTESKIGFIPALVMVYLRERVAGSVMGDWLLSGRVFGAQEALEKSLIQRLVPQAEITQVVDDFASQLCQTVSAESVKTIKSMMRQLPHMHRDQALDFAAEMNAQTRSSADCKKGINAFLDKKPLTW